MSESFAPVRLRTSPGFRVGISITAAVGIYGVSFGALATTSGLTVIQACALSLLMFTGGSQFAFIGVVAGGGTGAAALAAATLLGLRNGVYGMQLNVLLRPRSLLAKLGHAQITIDESTATASGQSSAREQRIGFLTAGIGIFGAWNAFTLLGALAGDAIGDPKAFGLDGAAVAAFLGLLWPRLKGREPVVIAVVCGLVTALAVPFLPPGLPIIVAALVAGLIGWFSQGPRDEGLEPDVDPYPGPHTSGTA